MRRASFIEHLEELRTRVIKSLLAVAFTTIVAYRFSSEILSFFTRHIEQLVFIYPSEAFITHLIISIAVGIFLACPIIIYQIWRFIGCGLKKEERKLIVVFGVFSLILFLIGCIFGYVVIFPIGLGFLLSFAKDTIVPMISVSKYISFLAGITIIFGGVFQLPLAMVFCTKLGIVDSRYLRRHRREAIVIIFIAAAFFTPPDVVTQCLMAIPLLLLYEVSIFCSWVVGKQKRLEYAHSV